MTNGMIYTLNRAEAEKEAERMRARLTPEQKEAHDSINEHELDAEGQLAAIFCILDRASKTEFCSYSKEAYRAIEAACYDAYMMGRQAGMSERREA